VGSELKKQRTVNSGHGTVGSGQCFRILLNYFYLSKFREILISKISPNLRIRILLNFVKFNLDFAKILYFAKFDVEFRGHPGILLGNWCTGGADSSLPW
jgi:hypothetical protein